MYCSGNLKPSFTLLLLENLWISFLLKTCLCPQSLSDEWDANIPNAPLSHGCYSETENKCKKHGWMSCCLQAMVGEQTITRTHRGCLNIEWQVSISNRKKSKTYFIISVLNCWLTDWLTHIKTTSSYPPQWRNHRCIQQKLSKLCKIRT